MARINTSNPLVHGAAQQKKASRPLSNQTASTITEESDTRSKSSNNSTARSRTSPKVSSRSQKCGSGAMFDIFPDPAIESGSSASNTPQKQKKTRTLRTTKANSLLLPLQQRPRQRTSVKIETDDYDKENDIMEEVEEPYETAIDTAPQRSPARRLRDTARTPRRSRAEERQPSSVNSDTEEDKVEDDSLGSLDDFIVSDDDEISYHETSDSETEEEKAPTPPPPKSTRKRLMRGRKPASRAENKALHDTSSGTISRPDQASLNPTGSPTTSKSERKHSAQEDLNLTFQLNELNLEDEDGPNSESRTQSTPTIIKLDSSPKKHQEVKRPQTPPSSPSKNRLKSPSKQKIRIPPTPHRESVDAFWSQEETNDWIDQHSPRKEAPRGRSVIDLLKDFDLSDNEGSSRDDSTSTDPEATFRLKPTTPKTPKSPSKTAIKKAEAASKREAKARRLSFNNKKAGLAETFLKSLDDAVTSGKVTQMAQASGGIKINWSKTLLKTAGRAHWKSERIRTWETADKPVSTVYTHHASIELAERIIDDEHRLINTVTHEYCHLANYMISNVTDNPHGASFKAWGRKCTEAMQDHPLYGGKIKVTTKHSYEIEYKYVWECVGCTQTYGRHSKSIDPGRQRCGGCKGRLEQIKPKPRNVSPKKNLITPIVQKRMLEDVARNTGAFTV